MTTILLRACVAALAGFALAGCSEGANLTVKNPEPNLWMAESWRCESDGGEAAAYADLEAEAGRHCPDGHRFMHPMSERFSTSRPLSGRCDAVAVRIMFTCLEAAR